METFEIDQTKYSPYIKLSESENIFVIKGRSLPSNAADFFEPVINWLAEYGKSKMLPFTIEIELEYFNTSTHKFLVHLINVIETFDTEKIIKWFYDQDDDDILETGQKLSHFTGVKFEFIPIEM